MANTFFSAFFIFIILFSQPSNAALIEFFWEGELSLLDNHVETGKISVSNFLTIDDYDGSIKGIGIKSEKFEFSSSMNFLPTFEKYTLGNSNWFLGGFEVNMTDLLSGSQWTVGFYDFNIFLSPSYDVSDSSPLRFLDEGNVSIHSKIFNGNGLEYSGYTGQGISKKVYLFEANSFLMLLFGLMAWMVMRLIRQS